MQILNIFPDLLNYSLFAPVILRIILGIIFIDLGYLALTTEKKAWVELFKTIHFKPAILFTRILGIVQIIGGTLLVLGLYTQAAALVFAIIAGAECFLEHRESRLLRRDFVFYVLLLAISVSLLFTGAGAISIDLPL